MSIPDRLWRVVKGHWSLASERVSQAQAQAEAYQELAETLRASRPVPAAVTPDQQPVLPVPPRRPEGTPGQHDPLEACYLLLKVQAGADLQAVDQAYQARLQEVRPETAAPGSPERTLLESRKAALDAAYGKLRDVLNPTETRFERLEF